MPIKQIDLNADLGETEGDYLELLDVVSSANVACGAHAGGGELLRKTTEAALASGVQVGAHPSYPDREGFGRVSMRDSITILELGQLLLEQVAQVNNYLLERGAKLSHIKAHGALYNDAMVYEDTAELICHVAVEYQVPIFGLPGSALEVAAKKAGVEFIPEGFLDRAFTESGTLVPRSEAGAVLDHEQSIEQAKRIVIDGQVKTQNGTVLDLPIRTICVHADTKGAAQMAKDVKRILEQAGVEIIAFNRTDKA